MTKKFKKLFSVVLALAMVVALLPMNSSVVYAYDPTETCGMCGHSAANHQIEGSDDNANVGGCSAMGCGPECECKGMTWGACKNADPNIAKGTFGGTGISWEFNYNTLTISGTGAMPDCRTADEKYNKKRRGSVGKAITTVVIKSGITSIGEYAFSGLNNLTTVTIPTGVNSIGEYAFQSCSKLESVTIPEGVTSIGNGAFYGCSALSSVTIPDGVTSLGNNAFYYCSNLTNITIPSSVTSIGNGAFAVCGKLETFTVNAATPPSIGTNLFKAVEYGDYPSGMKIVVPEGTENAYKTAWSAYADAIESAGGSGGSGSGSCPTTPSKSEAAAAPTIPTDYVAERVAEEEAMAVSPVTIDTAQYGAGEAAVVPSTSYNLSKFVTTKGIVKGIKTAVAAANNNKKDVAEIYTGKPFCFNKEIIKAIQEGNKTVVYYFAHEGHIYSVTVPATVDAAKVLEQAGFAGPLYVGQQLGTTRLIK